MKRWKMRKMKQLLPKRAIAVSSILLLLLLVTSTVGSAQSQNTSTTGDIFLNDVSGAAACDLHIEYTETIDTPASDPELNPKVPSDPGPTSWSRNGSTLTVKGNFPHRFKQTVTVYSTKENVKVSEYWWTDKDGKIQGKKIKVVYIPLPAEPDGSFVCSRWIDKLPANVTDTLVEYSGLVSAPSVSTEADGTGTRITIKGKLTSVAKKGQVIVKVEAPELEEDWVLEIQPPYHVVGGIVEFPQIEEPRTATPDLSEHNYGALAGIIAGAIAGVTALISAAWYIRRRRTKATS